VAVGVKRASVSSVDDDAFAAKYRSIGSGSVGRVIGSILPADVRTGARSRWSGSCRRPLGIRAPSPGRSR